MLPSANPQPVQERLDHEWTLIRFGFSLMKRFSTISSVVQHLSMTRQRHILYTGFEIAGSADLPRLKMALKAAADLFPVTIRERHALTPQQLKRWREMLRPHGPGVLNILAAFEVAFCGLLRSKEFCAKKTNGYLSSKFALTRDRVSFIPSLKNVKFAVLNISVAKKRASNNKYNERNPVILPFDPDADVNGCARLVELFTLDPIPAHQMSVTPLFRDVSLGAGQPLVYRKLFAALRNLVQRSSDVEPKFYGMHSLRIGAATALLAAGCPKEHLMSLGRWDSECYKLYARANLAAMITWQRRLGRQFVLPTETAALLTRNGIPIEGSSLWPANCAWTAARDRNLTTNAPDDSDSDDDS